MTYNIILKKLKKGSLNTEEALQELTKIGYAPNLVYDDNGHWAVSFNGFQTLAIGDEPEDASITCFVEKEYWKKEIKEALIYALEN